MSVPHQRKILIERASDRAIKDYMKVSNTSLLKALSYLDANAFKIWVYFVDNKDKYVMDLSSKDITNKLNISKSTYHRAIKELIDKGYLIQGSSKNIYKFKEVSELMEEKENEEINISNDYEELNNKYFNECQIET